MLKLPKLARISILAIDWLIWLAPSFQTKGYKVLINVIQRRSLKIVWISVRIILKSFQHELELDKTTLCHCKINWFTGCHTFYLTFENISVIDAKVFFLAKISQHPKCFLKKLLDQFNTDQANSMEVQVNTFLLHTFRLVCIQLPE